MRYVSCCGFFNLVSCRDKVCAYLFFRAAHQLLETRINVHVSKWIYVSLRTSLRAVISYVATPRLFLTILKNYMLKGKILVRRI